MPYYSFVEALYDKYEEDKLSPKDDMCEIFVVGSIPGRCSPSGRLILPKVLTLNGCEVDRAGNPDVIEELCQDVEELDLAQNQLHNLTEVNSIISHMPSLWFLNLSHNNFRDAVPIQMTPAAAIRSLVLNHTFIPWHVLFDLLNAMPKLEELHLSLNNYDKVEEVEPYSYPTVKILHISGNLFTSWDEVLRIGHHFPALESLVMADCHVKSIPLSDTWCQYFSNLQSLNLSNWQLNEWSDVESLNGLPRLRDLRVLGIPVVEDFPPKERRFQLIARLPGVTRLNGSLISAEEREDAERYFIRFYLDAENKPKRFYELQNIHGTLNPLAHVDLSPKRRARVNIVYKETKETRVINLQQSVKDFKEHLSSVYGLRPSKMRVFYVDSELMEIQGDCGAEELRYNQKKLYTYNIQDGDEFVVDHK